MKKTYQILFALFLALSFQGVFAQVQGLPFNDLPPQPTESGKCFAKCKLPDCRVEIGTRVKIKDASVKKVAIPAEYETITEQVLVKEESRKLVSKPARYETVTEKVLVKEASTKLTPVPAVYETVTEQVLVKDASTKLKTQAPSYETVTEKILVKPAYGEWERKKKAPNCFSQNPEDCYVLCWVERPAEYKTVTKKMLASSGGEQVIDVPAVYKTVTKKVLKTPATTKETIIPAQYKTITKKVLVEPARTEEAVVPAQYKTITRRVIKTPARVDEVVIPAEYKRIPSWITSDYGGFTDWVEVLCQKDTNSGVVRQIQQALKAKGYDPGVVDGIMGGKTRAAMQQYQVDNKLPAGNMNKETLRSLGIN